MRTFAPHSIKPRRINGCVNADEEKGKQQASKTVAGGSVGVRGGGSGTSMSSKAADELKKAIRAGEDGLLQLITGGLERQRQAECIPYNRRIDDLNAEYEKRKAARQKQVRTPANLRRLITENGGLAAETPRNLKY